MTENIETLFQKTKGGLFIQRGSGFLGTLLCKVEMRWSDKISTAAISSRTLYWNPDFFLRMDPETRITILAHELYHNGFLHGARIGERDKEIWNLAADHVINNLLQDHGYYMGGFPYVMDPKYKQWATEDVYDDLVKELPKGGSTAGQILEGSLGQDIQPMAEGDREKAIADVISATSTARITNSGDMPGEIAFTIDKFLNPKLPWETILFNFFNALTTEEYSYTRPNRRYEDPILPGRTSRNGLEHLIYYLDISGSVSDEEILRFNSEVKYIKETLEPEKLTLVTFDTQIHEEYVFERDDPFEKIVVTGRGGTDLHDVFKHAQRNNPTAMIVFSDLYVEIPKNPMVPIIWVCVDNPERTVPYGQLIHIKD